MSTAAVLPDMTQAQMRAFLRPRPDSAIHAAGRMSESFGVVSHRLHTGFWESLRGLMVAPDYRDLMELHPTRRWDEVEARRRHPSVSLLSVLALVVALWWSQEVRVCRVVGADLRAVPPVEWLRAGLMVLGAVVLVLMGWRSA